LDYKYTLVHGIKSAPGHFGTYLHSQIGTLRLVSLAPVMVYSAPVLKII
jgi:hypothetical protein